MGGWGTAAGSVAVVAGAEEERLQQGVDVGYGVCRRAYIRVQGGGLGVRSLHWQRGGEASGGGGCGGVGGRSRSSRKGLLATAGVFDVFEGLVMGFCRGNYHGSGATINSRSGGSLEGKWQRLDHGIILLCATLGEHL